MQASRWRAVGVASAAAASRRGMATGPGRRPTDFDRKVAPTRSVGRAQGEGGYGVDLLGAAGASKAKPWTMVNAYDAAGFRVNGVRLLGSVLLAPHASFLWRARTMADVTRASLGFLPLLEPEIELVVIGSGRTIQPLAAEVRAWLERQRIGVEVHTSANACATFNFLNQEERRVVGAMLALDADDGSI